MRGERLSWLQQEQSLTATEAEKQILSAALLVDLEFARNGSGVRATMIVTNSAGEQRFKTTAESKSLDAALLAPLIEDALTGLHVAPIASKTDHRLESQRFFREAQLRWSFKERATAIQAAESALLLDPLQVDIQILLATYLFNQAADESYRSRATKLPNGDAQAGHQRMESYRRTASLGERAGELYATVFRVIAPNSNAALIKYRERTSQLSSASGGFYQSRLRREDVPPEFRNEWEDLQRELTAAGIDVLRQEMAAWLAVIRADSRYATQFSVATGFALVNLALITRDSRPRTEAAVEFCDNWLTEYDRLPVDRRPLEQVRNALGDITGLSALRPLDAAAIEPLMKRLEQHPDPIVRLHGRRGRLFLNWDRTQVTVEEKAIQFRPVRQEALALLARPEMKDNLPFRRACYEFLYETFNRLSMDAATPEFLTELKAVCDEMTKHGELHVRLIEEWARTGRQWDAKTARQALEVLDAGIALSERTPLTLLGSGDLPSSKRQLQKARAKFLTRWPSLREKDGSQRVQTKLLMEFAKSPDRWTDVYLCQPQVQGDFVYGLLLTTIRSSAKPQPTLQLVRASLQGGAPSLLGSIAVATDAGGSWVATRVITGSCLHDDQLYVATKAGLFAFDLKSSTARLVRASKNFPTQVVRSVAWFNDHLYVGLEGGYLVSFAPNDETFRVLVSSRRKDKLSPLDDRAAFEIPRLVPDPPRRRLWIHTTTGHHGKGGGELWDYRPESGEFQRRLEFTTFPRDVSSIQQDRLIVTSGVWLVSLDLATDKTFTVANYPLGPNLTPDRKHFIQPVLDGPVQCAGRLWSSQAQGLTGQLRTVAVERNDERILPVKLPQLDKDEIYAGWYVAPVDEKRFLWSNHHRLPEQETTKPPVDQPGTK